MKVLDKVEIIALLKDKIQQAQQNGDKEVAKLQKLLLKLTKGSDVSFI